jgi:hypothetical protein
MWTSVPPCARVMELVRAGEVAHLGVTAAEVGAVTPAEGKAWGVLTTSTPPTLNRPNPCVCMKINREGKSCSECLV